ncbi:MAG: ABC transporter ATP-binding protein [Alphaproteobacteria bacterium]|nr:ABC transporter ATP-binding protein [Alphaproteobacteria bacterium]
MLEVRGLNVDIGAIPILRDAGLDLNNGEIVGLIGRNGAGKTTLLRSLMGLLPVNSGQMSFDGEELTKLPAQKRAHLGIGYMPEDRKLVPSLTSEENIMTPVWSMNISDWESRLSWIYKIMPEAEQFRDRPSNSLSGGQQKLVALARALMVGHKILLLDEPSEGIAPALAQRMGAILRDLKSEGVSILVAESNAHHVVDLIDRMFVIERGAIATQDVT